jgi:peptide/nickel transport system substrate-binding protein
MTSMNLPQSVTLDRNEDYWDGPVALAGAELRFIPDGGTRATLLQTGEAHAGNSLPIAAIPTLEADGNLVVVRGAQPRTNSLYINNQKAPLNDVRVRQAIQAAIDTDAIANVILEGAVEPAIGPFAPTAAWAPAGAQPIARDLDKARSLLADAGIAEGSLTLGLWAYPGRPELPDVAVAIQGMLAEVGINAEVRVADYAALEPDVLAGNFDMMLLSRSYLTDINDPAGYLRSDYTCEGSYNLSHFCDEEVDGQLEEVLVNEEPDARYAVYSQLATKFHEEAIDVYLYHPQAIGANSSRLQNYQFHPMEHFVLTKDLNLSE